MKTRRLYGVTLILLCLTTTNFGQEKVIPYAEYWQTFQNARIQARMRARRTTETLISYINGKVSASEEWLTEYDLQRNSRLRHTKIINGARKVIEELNIEGKKFCRKNDSKWRIVEKCDVDLRGSSDDILPDLHSRYSIEPTKLDGHDVLLYRDYSTYTSELPIAAITKKLLFWENKLWLNEQGLMLKRETLYGSVAEKSITSLIINIYEYDPEVVKIEAPIK